MPSGRINVPSYITFRLRLLLGHCGIQPFPYNLLYFYIEMQILYPETLQNQCLHPRYSLRRVGHPPNPCPLHHFCVCQVPRDSMSAVSSSSVRVRISTPIHRHLDYGQINYGQSHIHHNLSYHRQVYETWKA